MNTFLTAMVLPWIWHTGSDTLNRWDSKYEQHNLWWGLIKCKKVWIARLFLSLLKAAKFHCKSPFLCYSHTSLVAPMSYSCLWTVGKSLVSPWVPSGLPPSGTSLFCMENMAHEGWWTQCQATSTTVQELGNATKSNHRTAHCPFKSCLLAANWGLSVRPTLNPQLLLKRNVLSLEQHFHLGKNSGIFYFIQNSAICTLLIY